MTNTASATGPKPGLFTRMAYGVGGAAGGIKNNGFDYVLLLFYSQVLGLPGLWVAAAIWIALIVDAVSDPIVGYWSDNLRSSMGRRHPFLYAAAIPATVAYFFVWNPPTGLEGQPLFLWLLTLTIIVRVGYTLFEVPSLSLSAELSQDYDVRTSLMSFRYFFAWVGGLTVQVMLFAVFLQPSEGDPQGFFHLPGWHLYGLVGASSIFVAIMITALGTHHRIPHLKSPPPERDLTVGKIFSEIWETLSNPSFRALFVATLFGLLATGISATLNQYINGFFWNFTGDQIAILTFAVYLSAIMALILAPMAGRVWGKKRAAIIIGLLAFTLAPAPVFARLLGLLPENGTPELFYIVLVVTVFDIALIIAYQMLAAAMVTDIVEESELKTGRRSEGTFFAGITFIRKLSQGIGVMTASFILAFATIAPGIRPEDASADSVAKLGFGYAATLLTVWMLMMLAISFYRISREDHARNLAALAGKEFD
ncbi:MAG: MFS transporter [Hyphomonas sp.]|nr:MFS transporter [Henriciella sp.]MBO6695258.1 MFS transporter [Henriciella sp.]MCR9224793.1 MFS transporter [Hyphomonas sp.]